MIMSLADLDKNFALSQCHHAIARMDFALSSYGNFKQYIRSELDYAIQKLEQNGNRINFDLTEDQLTLFLLSNLENRYIGLHASHEVNQRGHCDITVKLGGFVWHGEAKKHTSGYSYLFKGYSQLTERYSTGTVNSASGGLIIYTKNQSCSAMMAQWEKHLTKCAPKIHACKQINIIACKDNPLVFYSNHEHTATKLGYEVIHYPVVLYHKPIDPDL